jgi:hypothetical protein
MLLLKDECALCKRVVSSSYLRRCSRCNRLYCFDCTTYTKDGYIICLNCARREVSPRRLGTKYSPLSRYLLRRGMFTGRVRLPIREIEGIIGANLPLNASKNSEWWNNTKGRPWVSVGWHVESVDMNERAVTFIRVAKPVVKRKKKESRKTEFFKRPLRFPKPKRAMLPSKTKIARAQARVRNVERQRLMNQRQRGKLPSKPAYEKRLFKPDAKPSTSN